MVFTHCKKLDGVFSFILYDKELIKFYADHMVLDHYLEKQKMKKYYYV